MCVSVCLPLLLPPPQARWKRPDSQLCVIMHNISAVAERGVEGGGGGTSPPLLPDTVVGVVDVVDGRDAGQSQHGEQEERGDILSLGSFPLYH